MKRFQQTKVCAPKSQTAGLAQRRFHRGVSGSGALEPCVPWRGATRSARWRMRSDSATAWSECPQLPVRSSAFRCVTL
eukprot:scaffold7381_cov310-Pinguiococcus_pyrenoidosus.AAC.97